MNESDFAARLFEQLDTLEHRYRRFVRLALVALAILTAATLWQLFVALPAKTRQIQQSRMTVIHQFCEDEKTLLTLVPPAYQPDNVAADSALNPHRDCGQFVRGIVR